VIRVLGQYDELPLDDLGPRVRVDYAADGDPGRDWLYDLVADLASDGLVDVVEADDECRVRLLE
jgi:A/G-specific adenine glycosylase